MNERKLNKLFEAARNEMPPAPSYDFEARVMRAIGRLPESEESSLTDQLNFLFPRLAFAAGAVIVVCVAGELALNLPDLTEGVAQISDQWLFAAN
jgi:hypothetical protein